MRPLKTLARLALAAGLLLAGLAPNAAALAGEAPRDAPPPPAISSAGEQAAYAHPFGCPWTSAIYTDTPNQAIPDFGVITSSVTASNLGAFTWQVQVTTTVQHTFNAQLRMYLIAPWGQRITLTTGNGLGFDNVFNGTVWRDDAGKTNAPGPVTMVHYANNVTESPVAPEEPLGALRGYDPNGTWTLEVNDAGVGETGTLVSWSLGLEALDEMPPIESKGVIINNETSIPDDGTPVTRTFTLPSAPFQQVAELSLQTFITHTNPGDLVIELQTNTGEILTIANHQGGNHPNVFLGTIWEDHNGNPAEALTDHVFTDYFPENLLPPQEPMAAVNGLNAGGGQWTLIVSDTVPGGFGFLGDTNLSALSYACQPDLEPFIDQPDGARLDAPGPVRIEVHNHGHDTIAPISLTTSLPTSLGFINATGAGWTCGGVPFGAHGGTLNCTSPSLASGAASTVTVLFSPPTAPLVAALETTVLTAGDSNSANNSEEDGILFAYHSANGQPWDVLDQAFVPFANSGGIFTGGQDAFSLWGLLELRMFNPTNDLIYATGYWEAYFSLVPQSPNFHWRTTHPVVVETLEISRDLYAPADADWLRYVDTFHNLGAAQRTVWVSWGGYLGSGNTTETTDTSSGDATLTASDTWGATRDTSGVYHIPPVGFALRSPTDTTYQGPGIFYNGSLTDTWPSAGNGYLGNVYKLVLDPGETASLAYFVYRGLAEGVPGPGDCEWYVDCGPAPAPGSQVTLAETTAAALAATPNFCGLSATQRASIVNWPGAVGVTCESNLYLPFMRR